MNHREVMQQALDALEWVNDNTADEMSIVDAALFDLRCELDKPEEKAVRDLEEAEQYIQNSIDCAPEPLKRLGEWLTNVLDENQWPHAERLLLGAIAAKPAAGAEGWAMVPKEPTWEMNAAGSNAGGLGYRDVENISDDDAEDVYKAMLAAAPQPPAPAVDVEAVPAGWVMVQPGGPRTPDNSMVICPCCTHQFHAISVDDQERMRALPEPAAVPTDEAIVAAFKAAGMNTDIDQMPNMLYSVRGQLAQLINGARALLADQQPAAVPDGQNNKGECQCPLCKE
jgi:hypothetical protein